MLLLLTTEKEQKKEYKEMLEGLCEEMPDQVWKVRKSKLGFKIVHYPAISVDINFWQFRPQMVFECNIHLNLDVIF